MSGEIFTLREVANYLKVAERTIYRLAQNGRLPAFKVGGSWRFNRAELDRWIKEQTIAHGGAKWMDDDGARSRRPVAPAKKRGSS